MGLEYLIIGSRDGVSRFLLRWGGDFGMIQFIMRKPFKKSLGKILVEKAHGGSGSRQLLLSQKDDVSQNLQEVTKGYLKPGAVFDWHSHKGIDEFFIVLKGTGKVTFKSGKTLSYTYRPGDIFYMPEGMEHRIECLGNEMSEYFFIRLKE